MKKILFIFFLAPLASFAQSNIKVSATPAQTGGAADGNSYHNAATMANGALQLTSANGAPTINATASGSWPINAATVTNGVYTTGSYSNPSWLTTLALEKVTGLQTALDGKANTSHTHSIANITGLQTALDAKQATLVSATNIKTINGQSLLGSGDLVISGGGGTADGNSYHTSITAANGSIALSSSNGAASISATASGTWGINITGNAATVTNGVYTTGSYANPEWITSLSGSKITGLGLAAHSNNYEDLANKPIIPGPQTLSIDGTTLSISGGNSVTLPSGGGGSSTGTNLGGAFNVYTSNSGSTLQFNTLEGPAQRGVKLQYGSGTVQFVNSAFEYYDKGTGNTTNSESVTLASVPFIPFGTAGTIEIDMVGLGNNGQIISGKKFIPFRRLGGSSIELFSATNISTDAGGLVSEGAYWQASASGAQITINAYGVIGVPIAWKCAYRVSYTSLILD